MKTPETYVDFYFNYIKGEYKTLPPTMDVKDIYEIVHMFKETMFDEYNKKYPENKLSKEEMSASLEDIIEKIDNELVVRNDDETMKREIQEKSLFAGKNY